MSFQRMVRRNRGPDCAERRNFYKVEKSSRDGQRIEELLFAGNSLGTAQRIFDRFITKRLTVRQRSLLSVVSTLFFADSFPVQR
jgi:hypothetical protein